MPAKKNFTNNKAKKGFVKQLLRYVAARYGKDDGTPRLEKDENFLIENVKKHGLEDEYVENKDIK